MDSGAFINSSPLLSLRSASSKSTFLTPVTAPIAVRPPTTRVLVNDSHRFKPDDNDELERVGRLTISSTARSSHPRRTSSSSFKRRPQQSSKPSATDVEKSEQRALKRTTTLVRALVELNVASQDTCSFLIRCSRVLVNGELVTDEKTTVSRLEDRIFVNGRDFGTVVHGTDHVDELQERSPRTHRDRAQEDVDSLSRQFNRNVDEGFYGTKKYKAGH